MITLIVTLALIGLLTYAIVKYLPMPAGVQKAIVAVAVISCVIIALEAFGLLSFVHDVPVPRVH